MCTNEVGAARMPPHMLCRALPRARGKRPRWCCCRMRAPCRHCTLFCRLQPIGPIPLLHVPASPDFPTPPRPFIQCLRRTRATRASNIHQHALWSVATITTTHTSGSRHLCLGRRRSSSIAAAAAAAQQHCSAARGPCAQGAPSPGIVQSQQASAGWAVRPPQADVLRSWGASTKQARA